MKYDICVFGGCSLDQTFFQNVDGSYDETPNSIAQRGKGSNQAVAASRAGTKVTMISRLGKDDIGKRILDNLNLNGVDTSHIEMVDGLKNDSCNIYVDINDKELACNSVGASNTILAISSYSDKRLETTILKDESIKGYVAFETDSDDVQSLRAK